MRKLFVLILALSLGACATTNGKTVDAAKSAKFVIGKTTYAEVLKELGEPSLSTSAGVGGKLLSYSSETYNSSPLQYVPIAGLFAPATKVKVIGETFTFDKKMILISRDSSELNH